MKNPSSKVRPEIEIKRGNRLAEYGQNVDILLSRFKPKHRQAALNVMLHSVQKTNRLIDKLNLHLEQNTAAKKTVAKMHYIFLLSAEAEKSQFINVEDAKKLFEPVVQHWDKYLAVQKNEHVINGVNIVKKLMQNMGSYPVGKLLSINHQYFLLAEDVLWFDLKDKVGEDNYKKIRETFRKGAANIGVDHGDGWTIFFDN